MASNAATTTSSVDSLQAQPELYLCLLQTFTIDFGGGDNFPRHWGLVYSKEEPTDHRYPWERYGSSKVRAPKADTLGLSTNAVLDAIAAMCVSEGKGNPMTALSLSMSVNQITLYLARASDGSGSVSADNANGISGSDKVARHLEEVWERVRRLCRAWRAETASERERQVEARRCYEDLYLCVFRFSYAKFRRRFLKQWPTLEPFLSFISTRYSKEIEDGDGKQDSSGNDGKEKKKATFPLHYRAFLSLRRMLELESPPDEDTLRRVVMGLEHLRVSWRAYNKEGVGNSPVGKWSEAYQEATGNWYSVNAGLDKIFALHEHVKYIVRASFSSRHASYIESTSFVVVQVPLRRESTSTIEKDAGGCEPYIRSVIADALKATNQSSDIYAQYEEGYDFDEGEKQWESGEVTNTFDEGVEKVFRDIPADTFGHHYPRTGPSSSPRPTVPLHPECALVVFHHENPDTRPYKYISTSKKTCFACEGYFIAYNHVVKDDAGIPFRLTSALATGTFAFKLSLPWAYPDLRHSWALEKPVIDSLKEKVVAMLRKESQIRITNWVKSKLVVKDRFSFLGSNRVCDSSLWD